MVDIDWRGECVAIVASGPSAKKVDLSLTKDRIHVIAINESWQLCPWADILYGCDATWWRLRKGVKEFEGLKISQDAVACVEYPEIQRIRIVDTTSNELCFERGVVGSGGNSGFQAFNLAIQFGVTGVILVGFDMRLDHGEHWHGRHPQPLSNPDIFNIQRWSLAFAKTIPVLKRLDVQVFNCSPSSSLKCFPKLSLDDAMKRWSL